MVDSLYDVFVEGTRDNSPAEQMKLAAAIAERCQIPVARVVEAMTKGRLRIAKGVDRQTADRIKQELEVLGAIALRHPAGVPLPPPLFRAALPRPMARQAATLTSPTGTPVETTPSTGQPPTASSPDTAASGALTVDAPAPLTALRPLAASRPRGPLATNRSGETASPSQSSEGITLAELPSGRVFGPLETPAALGVPGPGTARSGLTAAEALPKTVALRPGGRRPVRDQPGVDLPAPDPTPMEILGRDPFASPPESSPPIELATGPAPGELPAGDRFLPPSYNEGGALELALAPPAPRSRRQSMAESPDLVAPLPAGNPASAVSNSDTESSGQGNSLDLVRCPTHGLLYDRVRAAGCLKCFRPARATDRQSRPFRLTDITDSPARRAFVGLALALCLAFLPALFHARGNARLLERLRAEQAEVAARASTQEVVARYDELNRRVDLARGSGMKSTFVIWVVVAGGVMAGWYKIT